MAAEGPMDMDAQFFFQQANSASKPFTMEIGPTGTGRTICYYLVHNVNRPIIREAKRLIHGVHSCNMCRDNFAKIAGLFGPDGTALQLTPGCGDAYDAVRREMSTYTGVSDVFIVERAALPTAVSGVDPTTGVAWPHFCLNLADDLVTSDEVVSKIPKTLFNKLSNGSMDGRMEWLLGNLFEVVDGKCPIVLLEKALVDDRLKRKDFWVFRTKFARDIHTFASTLPSGPKWADMTDEDKMHTRMYALLYGGQYTPQENPSWKGLCQLEEIATSNFTLEGMITFMDKRTDPATYMVRQIAEALEKHNVSSRFTAALAWGSKADLDIWVYVHATGTWISYKTKKGKNGTCLDFDAQAGAPFVAKPVENVTFSDTVPGKYSVYVNCYTPRGPHETEFTVIVNLDGKMTSYEDKWDAGIRGSNDADDTNSMIHVCDVDITADMLVRPDLRDAIGDKAKARIKQNLPLFTGAFGPTATKIPTVTELGGFVLFTGDGHVPPPSTGLALLGAIADGKPAGIKVPDVVTLSQLQELARTYTVDFQGRDHAPAYVTVLQDPRSRDNLCVPMTVNTYYADGHAPRQPDVHSTTLRKCNAAWSSSTSSDLLMPAMGLCSIKTQAYDGVFVPLRGAHMPEESKDETNNWVVGAGMYPTELKPEFVEYREIWQSLHTTTQPTVAAADPAIGIFLHRKKEYTVIIGGKHVTLRV